MSHNLLPPIIEDAFHLNLPQSNVMLKRLGLKLSDFDHEKRVDEKSQKQDHSALRSVFVSVDVSKRLDERRAAEARKQGDREPKRKNRGDNGERVFGKDGLQNGVAYRIVEQRIALGYVPIETRRVRQPDRYTKSDEDRANEELSQLNAIGADIIANKAEAGEDVTNLKVEDVLNEEERNKYAYFSSVEEGLIKKTPEGAQVWKYVVRIKWALLRHEDPDMAEQLANADLLTKIKHLVENEEHAQQISKVIEELQKILKVSIWAHIHVWENRASVTINYIPLVQGTPRVLTELILGDNGFFRMRRFANPGHKNFAEIRAELDKQRKPSLRAILADKLEGKENGNTPLPPAS